MGNAVTSWSDYTFSEHVRAYLLDGWGVEDIAVLRGYDVDAVRLEVRILKESGELAKMYGLTDGPDVA